MIDSTRMHSAGSAAGCHVLAGPCAQAATDMFSHLRHAKAGTVRLSLSHYDMCAQVQCRAVTSLLTRYPSWRTRRRHTRSRDNTLRVNLAHLTMTVKSTEELGWETQTAFFTITFIFSTYRILEYHTGIYTVPTGKKRTLYTYTNPVSVYEC